MCAFNVGTYIWKILQQTKIEINKSRLTTILSRYFIFKFMTFLHATIDFLYNSLVYVQRVLGKIYTTHIMYVYIVLICALIRC